jgi:hypothetical protein
MVFKKFFFCVSQLANGIEITSSMTVVHKANFKVSQKGCSSIMLTALNGDFFSFY